MVVKLKDLKLQKNGLRGENITANSTKGLPCTLFAVILSFTVALRSPCLTVVAKLAILMFSLNHEAFMLGTSKVKHEGGGFDLFITTAPILDLNDKINVFGRVIKGEEVVQV